MSSSHTPSQHLQVDLNTQRILIDPDDPLPSFRPRPKAIMVIPIYQENEIAQYRKITEPTTAISPKDAWNPRARSTSRKPRRLGLFRKSSSYSPTPKQTSRRRDQSVPTNVRYDTVGYPYQGNSSSLQPSRGRSRSRYHQPSGEAPSWDPSQSSPYGAIDKARPPEDPLAVQPPAYQSQAMQGLPVAPSGSIYPSSHPGMLRPTNEPLTQNFSNHQGQVLQPNEQIGAGGIVGAPASTHPTGQYFSPAAHPAGSLAQTVLPVVSSLSHGTSHGQEIDEAIQQYYKLLPPHPKWCPSRCMGTKKAVCIGINYIGQRSELKGCANDARGMKEFIVQYYGFHASNVLLLTDDDRRNVLPTRREIFRALSWLIKGARKDDSLFFHYSGHGGQSHDVSGREEDDKDETIFPVDHVKAGDIIDDELYQAMVAHLPAGCRLTAIFDSCHSGTVLDLPYIHSAHGRLRSMKHISRRAVKRGVAPPSDVICFSACRDDETSTDTFKGGVAVGAMSHALIRSLKSNTHQTYDELLAHLREILVPQYDQKAQISGSHPIDLTQRFML